MSGDYTRPGVEPWWERPGEPVEEAERCCPGHGSMAHARGCRNHPEH